jgi:hypothetical protein
MNLRSIPGEYALCRLDPAGPVPDWSMRAGAFWSVTRTEDELSVVTDEQIVPRNVPAARGWALFRVAGTLPMDAIGIVAGIARVLADAKISIVCIATHDTDYFLVARAEAARARAALERAGYRFVG